MKLKNIVDEYDPSISWMIGGTIFCLGIIYVFIWVNRNPTLIREVLLATYMAIGVFIASMRSK